MSVSHRYPEVSPSWSLSLLFNFCFKPKVLVHFAALSLPKDREADSCATPVKWGWTCTAFRAEFPQDNPPPLTNIESMPWQLYWVFMLQQPLHTSTRLGRNRGDKGTESPSLHKSLPTLYNRGWKTVYLDNITLYVTYSPHPLFQIKKNHFYLPINVSRVVYQ